jgi:thiol:disulfide interchange protein DsbD
MFTSRCKATRRHCVALCIAGLAVLAFASQLTAAGSTFDSNLAQITASVDQPQVRPGTVVKVTIKCLPKPGYHTYPIQKELSDEALGLTFGKSEWLHPLWKHLTNAPDPGPIFLPGGKIVNGFEGEFSASIYVWVSDKTPAAKQKLELEIEGPVCDMTSCVLLRDAKLTVDVNVAGKPVEPPSEFQNDINSLGSAQPNKKPDTKPDTVDKKQVRALIDSPTAEDYSKSMQEILDSLVDSGPATAPAKKGVAFLYAGFFWGFVSLLTPCVFPMIPITVSFFLKQSERSHHRPITMAAVYCSTIVIVMTIAAVALLSFFQWLSQNAFTNLAIGVLFIVFALSLFGMYELELPSFIAQWTASKESRAASSAPSSQR